jgi:2'-5' RNA ligase
MGIREANYASDAGMVGVRRQITAFLPAPIGARVDEVRMRWDPEMARRIAAHITLVHDADDDRFVPPAVERVVDGQVLRVRLTAARCWETPAGGIYLGVDDGHGDIARIRRLLDVDESASVRYVPHVTLLHPRTVEPARLEAAWAALAGWSVDAPVVVDRIAAIEFD